MNPSDLIISVILSSVLVAVGFILFAKIGELNGNR
jgi:hypothetical protein